MSPELTEAVEKVARALCASRGHDPDWTGGGAVPWWTTYRIEALAAIRAVAEITQEATEAIRRAYDKAPAASTSTDYCARDWRAMHAASILGEALRDE